MMDKGIRAELRRAMLEYAQANGLIPSEKPEESCHRLPKHGQPVNEKTVASESDPIPAKSQDAISISNSRLELSS
jgi:hypothetical protein